LLYIYCPFSNLKDLSIKILKHILIICLLIGFKINAQPILVHSNQYAEEVSSVAYDSINNKIFYNIAQGCAQWNVPCALSYTPSLKNLINKVDYADNSLTTYVNSNLQVGEPYYSVAGYQSTLAKQTSFQGDCIYSNFGYYFNKIDTTNLTAIWSYSVNNGIKEISTFEMKNDSLFLFERDSTSGTKYYSVILKNKLTGNTMPYNSLLASNPLSSNGSIEGFVYGSTRINNKIILCGAFTASLSGTFIARNLVIFNIATGQLQAPPISMSPNSIIYDLKCKNNKVYIAGLFSSISFQIRRNFAVLDNNLNLLQDTLQFTGLGQPFTLWVDKIAFYDKYLIAKGNFNKIDNTVVSASDSYSIRVIDMTNNTVMPWTINLPPGAVPNYGYTYETVKNKLYLKKRGNPSPLYIYCFDPIKYSSNILFPGSTAANPSPSIAICAPDTIIFTAPIKYVTTCNWTYSGANATLVPIGNGSTAKLIVAPNGANGLLTVGGINDCGLSATATLNVVIKQKPLYNLPVSPQLLICNPDSTLLLGTSTNTVTTIWWRKNLATTINPQPFYAKTTGNYYMVVLDNVNGCKDSGLVSVNNFKAKPNAKITSHVYPGVSTPIDTVTCFTPTVSITAGSDTAGVTITWKSIATNSVFTNPLNISAQNNLKIIVTRNSNNCVDSSMIVLVGQNTVKPNVVTNTSNLSINCSYYTASLSAVFSPTNCSAQWTGPLSFTATNPATTTNPGKYFISVNDPANGCTKLDSVSVISSNALMLHSSNDTTVCKQSLVTINSSAIGTLTGVTFTWNTGNNNNSINVAPNVTTNYIVNANGPGSCNGTDTVKVIIPLDIQDSVIAYRSCDNNLTGSIVMFASGGIPPYKYSINNGTSFSSINSFTNIPFGNYNLVIKDSIGCIRTTTASLNSSSSLPVPKFLASTKNYQSDTIVLVDISIPKADSVQWLLPSQASIIGGNMFNPIIAMNDTGTFVITMKAFYGNCIINATKSIRFAPQDSLQANYNNANGIKTFSLYPNPNTGQFTVFVEFYKKQNASIQAWDTSPYKHLQQNFYDVDTITLPVNLSQLQNGAYILRVIGEYDARNKPFIISN
jgi:hypothetical protein